MSFSGKRPFEAILFDLGSTLVYFEGDMSKTISRSASVLAGSLTESGVNLNSHKFTDGFLAEMEKYRAVRDSQLVEYTTAFILRTYLSELGHPEVPEKVIRKTLKDMYAITQAQWKVEVDAAPTLQTLHEKGYRLGMISNAADDADVQILVDKAEIRPYFDFVITSAAQGVRKPHARIFDSALNHWGLKPHQVAMVGDTLEADILGARNIGIFAIWITRRATENPNGSLREKVKPDATIASLDQLTALLEELES